MRRAAVFALLLLVVSVLFCALGVWQVQRLAWKLDLIARVEARTTAPPVPAPGPGQWATITPAAFEYQRVRATGRYLNDKDTLVQAVSEQGAGYWVLTPFETEGFTVLVNRGFVPHDTRTRDARRAGEISGETTVTGLLRMSEPKGGFLRANDAAADRWHSRDVPAIAAARALAGPVAPYFIDADATPNAGGLPVGGLTVVRFANNHLGYALTWFALAAMAVAGAVLVWRRRV